MNLDDLDLKEIFPPWFWMLGVGLCVGCAVIIALYYVQHPDRNLFDDFARRIPNDLSSLDHPASEADAPTPES